MPKLYELGERYLIKYILERAGGSEELYLPPGDDAAALWFNGLLVACVDMLVWETDVPPGMGWRQVAAKAVVSAVSDAASKGARPRYLLLSLGLNPSMDFEEFKQLVEGIEEALQRYDIRLIGGDLNEQSSPTLCATVLAVAENIISRGGARPGDVLATTGFFGKTYAALHSVINGTNATETILDSLYRPQARVKEGIALASSGGVSACIDSSDGLAESLYLLSEASGVGFVVESLPLDGEAERYCHANGIDPFEAVFYGGEEYELVFTIKKGWEMAVTKMLEKTGTKPIIIGRATSSRTIKFMAEGVEREIERRGWRHFNESRRSP